MVGFGVAGYTDIIEEGYINSEERSQ